MTETLGSAGKATDKAKNNPLTDVAHSEAADRLKTELQEYVSAQAQRMLVGVGRKLGETTGKLNDIAEGNSPGFAKLALDGGRKLAEGKGRAGQKPTVIIEFIDVGVPLRTAYDQWTQYQDFSTFAKGVKSASRADDTSSDWQLKVLWSNRSWKATTTEQV